MGILWVRLTRRGSYSCESLESPLIAHFILVCLVNLPPCKVPPWEIRLFVWVLLREQWLITPDHKALLGWLAIPKSRSNSQFTPMTFEVICQMYQLDLPSETMRASWAMPSFAYVPKDQRPSHEKNSGSLTFHIEFWLFNRDPYHGLLGGGFKCYSFPPLPVEMIRFLTNIFQMGWNHHLVYYNPYING